MNSSDQLLHSEREHVAWACQQLQRKGLVVGTAGNVSVRVDDLVAISPSGVRYEDLTAEAVGVHRLDGEQVWGELKPSSELPLHLAVYATSTAQAVAHTHAPASTALGLVVDEVPLSHYYSAMFGGPIRVAPYATYGTDQLATVVTEALRGRTGALMANHGAVTTAGTLKQALSLLEYLEYVCEIQLRAMATGLPVKTLPEREIAVVAGLLQNYGQQTGTSQ